MYKFEANINKLQIPILLFFKIFFVKMNLLTIYLKIENMKTLKSKIKEYLAEFTPKAWTCLQEGYSLAYFKNDLIAGVTVGVISLPLVMAFAIASGVSPEKGLFTGIVAGLLISLLGGSRVQIGGPTGAFVVVVYGVIERHGYEGLALATLIAGGMMIVLALIRAGILLRFIPYSVTVGFTAGIAATIFSSQIKDFFGLPMMNVPADFIGKWVAYFHYFPHLNVLALGIGATCLVLIFSLRALFPRFPGTIVSIALTAGIVYIFDLPVETIGAKFGSIPNMLPMPNLPHFSWGQLEAIFPDAITIALLGSIESLLSAVVADGMTGHRHRSNTEVFAQGIANIGSVIFGGIPATGAIARTSANISLGAKTPFAGAIHAATIFFLMVFCAPLAALIPMPSLGAVLIFVAWNMSELPHIISISKGPKGDILVFLTAFFLTLFVDLTVAVEAGVLLAGILFLKNMSDTSALRAYKWLVDRENSPFKNDDLILQEDVPEGISVFEFDGPLFFGSTYALNEWMSQQPLLPRLFILRLGKVPLIDASGVHALKEFAKACNKKGIVLYLADIKAAHLRLLIKMNLESILSRKHLFSSFEEALQTCRSSHKSTKRSETLQLEPL